MKEPWEELVDGAVDRVRSLSVETFYLEYHCQKPVVVEGGARRMPAWRLWDADYLAERVGAATVTSRAYEGGDFLSVGWRETPLREVLDQLTSPDEGTLPTAYVAHHGDCLFWRNEDRTDPYPVGWGDRLNEGLAPLVDDLELPAFIRRRDFLFAALFLGRAGNRSKVHFDSAGESKVLAQIRGRKRVLLLSPANARHLHVPALFEPRAAAAKQVAETDLHRPDFARFPDLARARCRVAEIGPGDLLYWPSYWFHDVSNLGSEDPINVMVSFGFDEARVSALAYRRFIEMARAIGRSRGRRSWRRVLASPFRRARLARDDRVFRALEALALSEPLCETTSQWEWDNTLEELARAKRRPGGRRRRTTSPGE